MRTIDAPGCELREIDRSQYTPAMVGTAALVTGFANKGQLYKTMQFTSRAAWLNYYGEPDNEAERYFYNACMEVINQGGKLYCARIPYENDAKEKFPVKVYKISNKIKEIPSVGNYLDGIDNFDNLLAGEWGKFGYSADRNLSSENALCLDDIKKVFETYNERVSLSSLAFKLQYRKTDETNLDTDWQYYPQTSINARLEALFDTQMGSDTFTFRQKFAELQDSFADASAADLVAQNLFKSTESGDAADFVGEYWPLLTAHDSPVIPHNVAEEQAEPAEGASAEVWRAYDYSGYFDGMTDEEIAAKKIELVDQYLVQSGDFYDVRRIFGDWDFSALKVSDYAEDATHPTKADYVKAFVAAYVEAFGKDADEYRPWNFTTLNYKAGTKLYDFWFANKEKFDFINRFIVPYDSDYADAEGRPEWQKDGHYGNLTPYVWGERTKRPSDDDFAADELMNNFMSYYTAAVNCGKMVDTVEADRILDAANRVIRLRGFLNANDPRISKLDPAADFCAVETGFEKDGEVYCWDAEKEGAGDACCLKIKDNLAAIVQSIGNLEDDPDFKKLYDQLSRDAYEATAFGRKVISWYLDNTNVEGDWDRIKLNKADSVGALFQTIDDETVIAANSGVNVDKLSEAVELGSEDKTFFDKYETPALLQEGETWKSLDSAEKCERLLAAVAKTINKKELLSYVAEVTANEDLVALIDETTALGQAIRSDIASTLKWTEIRDADDTCDKYVEITSDTKATLVDLSAVAEYEANETKVPTNCIYLVDKTQSTYDKVKDANGKDHECIGIIPVVTTAANALFAQSIIECADGDASRGLYQALSCVESLQFDKYADEDKQARLNARLIDVLTESAAKFYENSADGDETVSDQAAAMFSPIQCLDTGYDRENLKKIGVCVFKAFLDATEGNKISYNLVEAFVGELDKDAVNPNTGVQTFIDAIVNSQSEYIYCFSNCFNAPKDKDAYLKQIDILTIKPQKAATLGFYEDMVKEDISLTKSIFEGLNKVYDKLQDINDKEIDIVCDAGQSNIAQYIYSVYGAGGKGSYDPDSAEAAMYKLKSRDSVKTWKTVILDYFDNFCKKIRKDCMFIADGPRPFCLTGNKKLVRETKPSSSIDVDILPKVNYISGINTSYGAGYSDWFQVTDEFSGEYFWCPPSIQAMGVYIYTDTNFDFWEAPAGLNRGVLNVLDVAFSPTVKQAGAIYTKNWNYAISYPNDGIVLEGQKTFQTKPSAFDRVNVRRLFLRLERQTYKVARYFVYEGNTAYNRQRLVDTLDPIFKDVKERGGVYDYRIICDESINTPDVIDRNELKVKIGIKPTKTAEFILIDFIALSTGGSFEEAMG